ncbi:unnamed protein product, partial [Protopolystoma xenopodis]
PQDYDILVGPFTSSLDRTQDFSTTNTYHDYEYNLVYDSKPKQIGGVMFTLFTVLSNGTWGIVIAFIIAYSLAFFIIDWANPNSFTYHPFDHSESYSFINRLGVCDHDAFINAWSKLMEPDRPEDAFEVDFKAYT